MLFSSACCTMVSMAPEALISAPLVATIPYQRHLNTALHSSLAAEVNLCDLSATFQRYLEASEGQNAGAASMYGFI